MKHVSFELTMPNVGSWNGRWTGQDNKYYRVYSYREKSEEIKKITELMNGQPRRGFYYNFGDGWGANVAMEFVDLKEKKKRIKISQGFSGYEWMITSIIKRGKITTED